MHKLDALIRKLLESLQQEMKISLDLYLEVMQIICSYDYDALE